ncbi:hypothetical protein G7Y79_00075g099110 [Physcia stellaris]|nr:hypothetical protein G7Y79_00075g099110 [Physcia stellaris]
MEAISDMTAKCDVPMEDVGLQVHPPTRKHKRPLTRRMPGERNFTRLPTTLPSAPKAPRVYTTMSYVGPSYGDPRRFTMPDRHYPSFVYDEIDPYEYAFEPSGTEHGYGCQVVNPVESFSCYRNYGGITDPTQEPAEAICRRLNCWLDTPHTHDSEEILSHLENEQKRAEYSSTEDEEEVLRRRPARKKVKKNNKPGSTRPSTSLLGTSATSSQDLKRALPRASELVPQATADEANLAQLLAHRPPQRTFTLAIRPAISKQSLAKVAPAPIAGSRPPSEEEIRGTTSNRSLMEVAQASIAKPSSPSKEEIQQLLAKEAEAEAKRDENDEVEDLIE